MNTKHCVYKNCGNTSAFSQKLTFFSFPLKDVEKCRLWARMAGCEVLNLKNKYLCENHFNTIYISKTPRRTVLLPNAVPYSHDENKELNEDDLNTEHKENVEQDEILLDQIDNANDLIYNDNIEMVGTEDVTDENTGNLLIEKVSNINVKTNTIQKMRISRQEQPAVNIMKTTGKPDNDFDNHVTKRQKLQPSLDNMVLGDSTSEIPKLADITIDEDHNWKVDNTIDNPDITTFIYKGEEYIQMPKRIYLHQRTQLDTDIKRYRNIIQGVKSLVNSSD